MSKSHDTGTGPGTTKDPNQTTEFYKDRERSRQRGRDVPEDPTGPPQRNPDPATGPGTTDDPNQSTNR
jgi:hypothetical protein